jgi:flagellar hook-associated protein 3 FlgL
MRVTGNSFINSFLDQINLLSARQQRLQNQAATGQRITAPEDDPAAMERILSLRDENQNVQQYSRNIAVLQERATNTFSAIKSLKTVSDRAGEIAVLADGMRSPEELKVYAAEISQMIQSAVATMNTRVGDRYLFGGTRTDIQPYTVTVNPDGTVQSVDYQGHWGVVESEIAPGSTIAVDVAGENNFGSGPFGLVTDSRNGADFLNHLISLQNHLLAGDTNAISATDRPNLRIDEDNILAHIGNSGATQMRLESAAQSMSERSESLDKMISRDADADLAETLVQLSQTQNAYQAALQSGATMMRTTLLDFLR